MFERFTERARQVVVLAQEEARILKHDYIGTEHILLGLLREEDAVAARVLESLYITAPSVRTQVVAIAGSGEEVTSGQIPFTPRAKKVLERALREALSRGHTYIGTEHLLLGLVGENEGIAARVLLDSDADSEKVRSGVMRVMSGPEYEETVRQALSVRQAEPAPPAEASTPTPTSFARVLARTLEQAAAAAGDRPLDAGDLIIALLEQPERLISSALAEAGTEVGALHAAIEAARLRGG